VKQKAKRKLTIERASMEKWYIECESSKNPEFASFFSGN